MSPRHTDFERIKHEFENYYCKGMMPCPKGEEEYYSWLKALQLDETLPYGQTKESFQWAKNMISFLREDADNKYYRLLVGFPLASMNDNIYTERDLVAAALSLVGVHPSLNHKDEFWFSPDNIENKWGVLTAIGGKYEEGAVETILQVPKTAVCPICNGAKMTELIDTHKIVNVSLEGGCQLVVDNPKGQHECIGFRFNQKGFSLLTSDVLPGIPLARIFPLESFLPFSQARHAKHRSVKIVGFERMSKTQEGDPSTTPAFKPPGTAPDHRFQCPQGNHWSGQEGKCIPDDPAPLTQTHVPEGSEVVMGTEAAPDTTHKPVIEEAELQRLRELAFKILKEGEFEDCVVSVMASNPDLDEESAKAICASQCQALDKPINHELELAEAISRASDLEMKLSAEKRGRATEVSELTASLNKKNLEATQERSLRIRLEGRNQELAKSKDKYDDSMNRWNRDRIELEAKTNKLSTELTEAIDNTKKYKQLHEATQTELDSVTSKYRDSLTVNHALNKKITSLNEETLNLMKKVDDLEERLKSAKRLGKHISTKI